MPVIKTSLAEVMNDDPNSQEKKMLRAGDQHFDIIMRMFTIEQASRIAKTWLIHYQLPLDPSRLKNFDLFHERCGPWVLENAQHIKAY